MPRKGAYAPGPLLLAMPVHADSLAAWINRYIESMVVGGMQPMTAMNCRSQLSIFNAWCHERDLLRPSEITKPILERWQRYLFYYRKRNGQPMTMQHQVVLLHRVRGLFRWLARHNHIVANPASDLELPRSMPCSLPEVLTVEEAEAILATFDTTQTSGLINRTMAEVLYSTAIRRTELASLGLYDIDLAHGVVHVRRGKGGKPRRVPIGERALAWVQKYLDEARGLLLSDQTQGALFLNERGEALSPPTVAR